jgi:CHAT domain-containing protein/tetratricopeptide (TPR) repeat protein
MFTNFDFMRKVNFIIFIFLTSATIAQQADLNQAIQLKSTGNYDQAYASFKKASDVFHTNNQSEKYAEAHLEMVDCQILNSAPFQAKSLAENTLEFIEKEIPKNKELKAKCLTLLGLSNLNLGRNDEALEKLLEAEANIENENLLMANCYNALGIVYGNMKNNTLAVQYHEKSLSIKRKILGREDIEVANSFNNLGLLFTVDDPLQALIYFNRAKQIYDLKLGNSDPRTIRTVSNMAFANVEQGNYEEGLKLFNEINSIYQKIYPDKHVSKAYILSSIGRVYLKKGDLDQAINYQNQALQMYISLLGEKHPDIANSYFLLGEIYKGKSQFQEAAEFYQHAIYANLPSQSSSSLYDLPELSNYLNADILLRSLQAKGIALEALHFEKTLNVRDLTGAINTYKLCDELITIVRRQRLNEQDKIRLGEIAKEVYEKGIQLSIILSEQSFRKNQYLKTAFDFCERSKSSVLLEAITESKAKSFSGIPNELIVLEDSLKDEIAFIEQQLAQTENLEDQDLKDLLFSYQNEYRNFIANLETNYPNYFNLKYSQSLATLEVIQDKLNEDAALLAYFIGQDEVYIFMVTKKKIKAFRKTKSANFEKQTTGLRNAIKYNIKSAFIKSAKELHAQLIPDLPKSINELIILPDGVLGTIPFEALVNPKDESTEYANLSFLLKKYHISYDYSATLFTQRSSKDDGINPEILLIAPVSFENNEVKMSNLPDSKSEVEEIRYLFMGSNGNATIQTGNEASESNFKAEDLGKYRFVHFATHGQVNESEPALSRIFLSPDKGEDGSLYTGEIYNLKINADLVTLSACETGLGKVAKGEGIVGLSRALQYAGANNIIVSLWQVADASTSQMMIEFYKYNLSNDHHGYNTALRNAKLSLLNSDEYNRPYFWAPFILVGM